MRKKGETKLGRASESWCCVDCGIHTAPGASTRRELEDAFRAGALRVENGVSQTFDECNEVYTVKDAVWKAAGMEPWGGCLCIGCLEKRLGRMLTPKDFTRHVFNNMPGTERLRQRRGDYEE